MFPAASRATTTSVRTLRIPLSGTVPARGRVDRRSEPLTRTVTVAASETRTRSGRESSSIAGACRSSVNGSVTCEVPTASVTSSTAV